MLTFNDLAVWKTFVNPGEVIEMRIVKVDGRYIISGYFDNHNAFCRALKQSEGMNHAGAYFTLHQVIDPRLIARSYNHLKQSNLTTSDNDVLAYRWLPVDIDPVRPSGISSSDLELQAALELRRYVSDHVMREIGLPAPIKAMSGNGGHLLFRLPDIPANDDNKGRIKGILNDLALRFNNDYAKIDTSVFNPARIWKLYGTTSRKGDVVPAGSKCEARPHRMAYIETLGDQQS
jgi:hypothetical protein